MTDGTGPAHDSPASGAVTAAVGQTHGAHVAKPLALAVGAIGVVFGDIGTSPLYAVREAFENPAHRLEVDRVNVLGAVSIITWTLVLIIAVKYVLLVLRADNQGEGGILALTALVDPERRQPRTHKAVRTGVLVLLGLFGTALLFGDGMITPAISVLSAVEGLELVQPGLDSYIVPIAVAILIGLFFIQRFGTGKVGRVFGPVMVVWFATMTVLGLVSIARRPEILQAVNPVHAVRYFTENTTTGFLSMGALFLVVTGGEALYADLGHFGRKAITGGWFVVVMPALLITYYGIGALLLRDPESIRSPFFLLAPDSLQLPMVILATLATIIASQALISGVFSLTLQSVQLGYAPLTRIVYTSPTARGQIYVPLINWGLMIACVGLVVAFGSSARLAAAYGLSVTGTMAVTTILFAVYAHRHWHWNPVVIAGLVTLLLLAEGAFLLANVFKIPDGGWFPLVVGVVILVMLTTWKRGRALVAEHILTQRIPLEEFVTQVADGKTDQVTRIPGTAVFLHSQSGRTPPGLLALTRTTGALHEDVYIVSIVIDEAAYVDPARRVDAGDLGHGIRQVTLCYGFMEQSTVADDLDRSLQLSPETTDYFLGREAIRSTNRPGMARWREALFALMNRNASDVATHFQLPDDRVIELGVRVDI